MEVNHCRLARGLMNVFIPSLLFEHEDTQPRLRRYHDHALQVEIHN